MQALRGCLGYIFCFLWFFAHAQSDPLQSTDSLAQQSWVNTTYDAMDMDQRIGQLFMMSVSSNHGEAAKAKVEKWINEFHIGGLIFSKGGPERQARMTNDFQKASRLPLLIGMDAEWGLAMRLDSTFAYPWNMTLGAIRDNKLIEEVGKRVGVHCKRLGVHINFAPVVDVNINPDNPIIGNRSFGEDVANVSQKALAFMTGMQSVGVLASAKHFPGHGDTATDSHHALPVIDFPLARLDSVELAPYKTLIQGGLASAMVAHLSVPYLEAEELRPSSLSRSVISGLLKGSLSFDGLVFTDALNMKGVANYGPEGKVAVEALLAGNDVLLMPSDIGQAVTAIKEAVASGRLSESRIEASVKKILKAKYKVGLYKPSPPIELPGLAADLNALEDRLLYAKTCQSAITAIRNHVSVLPIKRLKNKKIAYVALGDDDGTPFYQTLRSYADVTWVKAKDISSLRGKLAAYNTVIVGFHKSNASPWKSFKFNNKDLFWLTEMARMTSSNLILASFAKPYNLGKIPDFKHIDGVLVGYQNSPVMQERMAQAIFGANKVEGVLPVSVHPDFPVNTSIAFEPIHRLGYAMPEEVGMTSEALAKVDTLVQHGLDSLMFPGAQVLVARKGKVVYHKAFGKTTYKGDTQIDLDKKYDLASLTKILGTLPMVMKMEEEGKLGLETTFGEMLPVLAESELKNVTVLKALSHYGRLPAWIAFYIDTLDESRKPAPEFYRNHKTEGFNTKVFDKLYLADVYQDSIYNRIARQDLKSNRYRYSDVGYYVFKKYIESSYRKPIDLLVNDFLYTSLGAYSAAYNPLDRFKKEEIVPSEEDTYYRYQRVQGYVHDMGAAMQGGVGGHAGLFANANDVAKIMQMYLQGGYYGGDRFFETRTVKKFNTCYFCHKDVRRGVGFDKPQLKGGGPACDCVSSSSFGHSGFTGTYTWADPEEELVYVFLSNRTYPTASNTLLVKTGLRTRIQEAIYEAILN
ncbi:glycoside hydrolase family 3 N-terminal domain-containing protein [Sediminicola luteus]|uniref:beta-N-acetylhexosaminidase n=1 Tax=Sediminicola luteus TaxID=319238 RepID=A0A2A4G0S1_9FLAO|nr:glycoside hydrolase family 3 N-terminal domain-containing protein [Sediminicola luteus]PCE62589.1 beta-N-acetylglucosaminidase [Sediminicola luteus]